MKFIFEFIKILTSRQKYNLLIIQILIVIMSLFELISIISIAPFMTILTDPSLIYSNQYLYFFYNYMNFSNQNNFLIFLAICIFILFFISMTISIYTIWRLLRFSQFVGSEISISLFQHYLDQDWIFHSQNSSNDFSRKIFEEVKRLTGGIIQPLLNLNNKLILAIVMLIAIFIYNFWIALISFLIFGSMYLILFIFLRKKLFENSEKISDLNKNRYNVLGEAFGGIKELLINNKSSIFIKEFVDSNLRFASTHSMNQSIAQLPRYAIELIGIGSVILLALYLLILNESELNVLFTTLSIFALAGYKILPAFQQIFASIATIKGNLSAFYSINKELKNFYKKQNQKKLFSINFDFNKNIKLQNVSFIYSSKKTKALEKISLEIEKFSKIGIVGKSGSGKSTLIDILSGLLTNYEGKMLVDNVKIDSSNIIFWKDKISYIPQNIFLFDSTILENITFEKDINNIDNEKLNKSLEISLANEFVSSLPNKIRSSVGQRGIQLSGGQKQRIGIARALYQDKDIIIFDEATNSLDLETEKKIFKNIINHSSKKTVLLVTHRLENLSNFDKIFFIKNSQLNSSGSYKNLVNNDLNFRNLLNNTNVE